MNRIYLIAITGEMCCYTAGIRFPYNPFTSFKQQYEKVTGFKIKTNKHLEILESYVKPIYDENEIGYHALLLRTIQKLQAKRDDEVVDGMMGLT